MRVGALQRARARMAVRTALRSPAHCGSKPAKVTKLISTA